MPNLNPLIRLRRFTLEERQRALAKLYAQVEELEIQKRAILDSVESEREVIDENTQHLSMMTAFLHYLQASQKQVEDINNQISSLDIKINRAIEEMREAFGELKKIEITRDRRLEDIRQENLKREDAMFSDIAIEMWRRGKGS